MTNFLSVYGKWGRWTVSGSSHLKLSLKLSDFSCLTFILPCSIDLLIYQQFPFAVSVTCFQVFYFWQVTRWGQKYMMLVNLLCGGCLSLPVSLSCLKSRSVLLGLLTTYCATKSCRGGRPRIMCSPGMVFNTISAGKKNPLASQDKVSHS